MISSVSDECYSRISDKTLTLRIDMVLEDVTEQYETTTRSLLK